MDLIILFCSIIITVETTYLTIMKWRQRKLKVTRGALLLDTSALMDGRIVEVAKTGIITAEMIIPRSVLNEMQLLADKADSGKRARARQGLENVRTLEKIEEIAVTIVQDGHVGSGGVDERLLDLAQKYGANIATVDYNLNKVAKTLGITIVNVNELAQSLRFQHLPGEKIALNLVQAGAQREQAVGYLDDGTMVVVEEAKNLVSQTIEVEIIRSLQTEAGRMMFAKKLSANHHDNSRKSATAHPNAKSATKSSLVKSISAAKRSRTIKSSPAFHSDQLTKTFSPESSTAHNAASEKTVAKKSASNRKNRSLNTGSASAAKLSQTEKKTENLPNKKPRRTSKSAEEAIVALANKK